MSTRSEFISVAIILALLLVSPFILGIYLLGVILTIPSWLATAIASTILVFYWCINEDLNYSNYVCISCVGFACLAIPSFCGTLFLSLSHFSRTQMCYFVLSLNVLTIASMVTSIADTTSTTASAVVFGILASVLSLWISICYLNLWLPVSLEKLLTSEEDLFRISCRNNVKLSVVAELGTVEIYDSLNILHASYNIELDHKIISTAEKPILVLIHGFGGGNGYWSLSCGYLQERFRVYLVELPGCGRSERVPFLATTPDMCLDLFATGIEKWRDAMRIESFCLLGHSLGSHAAAAYYKRFPSRVRHLFLASPVAVGHPPDSQTNRILGSRLAYKMIDCLWSSGITPMDFLRFLGPYGLGICEYSFIQRIERSHEESDMRLFSTVFVKALAEYTHLHWCLPSSGDQALAVMLLPGAYGKNPLITWLPDPDIKEPATDMSPLVSSQYRSSNDDKRCPVTLVYGSPSHDWMEAKYGIQLAGKLKNNGILARVFQLKKSGHLLYLDEAEEFSRTIITSHFGDAVAN